MVESGSLHASCLAPWLKSSLYTLRYGAPIPSASYAALPPCNSPYIVNNFLRGILFLINEESGLPLYFLLHSASSFLTSFTLFPSIVNHLRIGRCSPFLLYFLYFFCCLLFLFSITPAAFSSNSISLKCVSNWAKSDSQSQVVVLSFLFCLSGLCQLHSVLVGGSMPRLCQRDEMIYVSVRHRTTLSANTPLSCSFTLADFRLLKAEYKDVVR